MGRETKRVLLRWASETMGVGAFPRRQPTTTILRFAAIALLLIASSVSSRASELNGETLRTWKQYTQAQNARVTQSLRDGSFLWSEQSPDRLRRLRQGEILVAPMGENPKIAPLGLIHHWIGAIFLPNTSLDSVLTVVRDYDSYRNFFAPNVIDSRLLHQGPTEDAFSLVILNKAIVAKFALSAEFQSSYVRVNGNRCYSVGASTRIHEVEDYGEPGQYELPPDTGHGFIWRLYNISRFEQRDGGVYVELEAIVLSRDVPGAIRWLVSPTVRRVSKNSMLVSLQKTQEAVFAPKQMASRTLRKDDAVEGKASNKALLAPKGFRPSAGY